MVLARDERDASRIKTLALHGMTKDAWKRFGDDGYKHYQVVECGFKYNMMDLQAGIGIHQLKRGGKALAAPRGNLEQIYARIRKPFQ